MMANNIVGLSTLAYKSSPVYQFQRTLAYTLGQSANVMVSKLDDQNSVEVIAATSDLAKAISQVIKLDQQLGDINLKVMVKDLDGNTYEPDQGNLGTELFVELARLALINNPLIQSVVPVHEFSGKKVPGVAVLPTTIQFWNDNLENPSLFTTLLASDGFELVLREEFKVYNQGKDIGNL
ncbi:hypothetical protein [Photobacterium atrarenae]|uniref:Uncharacterized protein n=1 Tax=Photobacterium atrarenae TaxID=865757 RepID=A0ABY5GLF9_9GAMM|nr:hypothetical protein [Photobacterium atrarenae]UTV29621.1 hypothetical protein NNL38_21660 [Photobacterium atrarenae]